MPMKTGELRLMVDEFKKQVRGMGKELATKLGQIGEPMSSKEQMEAWKEIKWNPEAWSQLISEKGPEKVEEMRKEMERRERISASHTRTQSK